MEITSEIILLDHPVLFLSQSINQIGMKIINVEIEQIHNDSEIYLQRLRVRWHNSITIEEEIDQI